MQIWWEAHESQGPEITTGELPMKPTQPAPDDCERSSAMLSASVERTRVRNATRCQGNIAFKHQNLDWTTRSAYQHVKLAEACGHVAECEQWRVIQWHKRTIDLNRRLNLPIIDIDRASLAINISNILNQYKTQQTRCCRKHRLVLPISKTRSATVLAMLWSFNGNNPNPNATDALPHAGSLGCVGCGVAVCAVCDVVELEQGHLSPQQISIHCVSYKQKKQLTTTKNLHYFHLDNSFLFFDKFFFFKKK